ncbi:MAG TPA: 4-hydroxybenzoate octaprenyltransferase, partial [Planctomycetaceae bacterium]|nr:4-hydroxybenzoate octaprenyltransferase [Planctomycetaceae bacterium]
MIYACQDYQFDRAARLHSVPARFGIPTALRLAGLSHLGTVACLVALWSTAHLGVIFLVGVAIVAVLLAYEHWLVRPEDLDRVNIAFFHVNAVISIGLFLIGWADVWFTGLGR